MKSPSSDPAYPPLSEQTFYILLSLFPAPQHGYAILKGIEKLSQGRLLLSVSTLYTCLKRMLEQEWIERVLPEEKDESGRPRKLYQLTDKGRDILYAEKDRLKSLLQAATWALP